MKKYSEISKRILSDNDVSDEKYKHFIKELRLTLRLDYEIPAIDVRKMNDNLVIETWFKNHSEEQIGGS